VCAAHPDQKARQRLYHWTQRPLLQMQITLALASRKNAAVAAANPVRGAIRLLILAPRAESALNEP
jgi:hypothetical protein